MKRLLPALGALTLLLVLACSTAEEPLPTATSPPSSTTTATRVPTVSPTRAVPTATPRSEFTPVTPPTETPLPVPAALPTPTPPPTPPDAVAINPGEDIQAMVNAHPPGTAFLLKQGTHRHQNVTPRSGNTFAGEIGPDGELLTTMSGGKVLDAAGFTREGNLWVIGGQTQELPQYRYTGSFQNLCGEDPSRNTNLIWPELGRCRHPEDLFLDDRPLLHRTSKNVVGPGEWYFDYEADKIYLGDNPAGHVIETSVTPRAFKWDSRCIAQGCHNVTIQNLVIEKYANLAQTGAIYPADGTGRERAGRNWKILNNEIRHNHGYGLYIGHGMQAIGNHIHDNGFAGIGGVGTDVLVEGNEIAFNNYARHNWLWGAGGSKFARTENLIVRNNYVHHNFGVGLWTDISNRNVLYECNTSTDNWGQGIFHEISFASEIRNNVVMRNGIQEWESRGRRSNRLYGAQIMVSNSSDVNVHHNTVVVSAQGGAGIGLHQIERERDWLTGVTYRTRNVHVHDNDITLLADHPGQGDGQPGSLTGGMADWEISEFFTGNNRFSNNTYHVPNGNGNYWYWSRRGSDQGISWSEFGASGQGANGKKDTRVIPEPEPLVRCAGN